jgi:hypothetical protein
LAGGACASVTTTDHNSSALHSYRTHLLWSAVLTEAQLMLLNALETLKNTDGAEGHAAVDARITQDAQAVPDLFDPVVFPSTHLHHISTLLPHQRLLLCVNNAQIFCSKNIFYFRWPRLQHQMQILRSMTTF